MRKLLHLYLVYVFWVAMPVWVNADKVPDISGEYTYQGTGPKGHYEGTAIVYQKDRAVLMQWDNGKLVGFGFVKGTELAIAFASDGVGVGMLCDIRKDELRCEWPDPSGQLWTERHTRGAKRKEAD